MVLARLLASLHDDDGNVAVAGLHESTAAAVDYPPERVRAESGLLDGVSEIGSGSVPQRLWAKPAITVKYWQGVSTRQRWGLKVSPILSAKRVARRPLTKTPVLRVFFGRCSGAGIKSAPLLVA